MRQRIEIPILNNEYKVIVCWRKEAIKVLKDWGYPKMDLDEELKDMRGRCFWHKGCHPVIVLPKKPETPEEIGTLAHEAIHAVDYIFAMLKETSSEEVFAHSVGAVVREVLKR